MSLVAYGDSDDGSSDSEAEESSMDAKTSSTKTASESLDILTIASEIKPFPTNDRRSKLSSLLPKPQHSAENAVFIKSQPQPKISDLKSINMEDEDEIIEVEEEYVPLSQIRKSKHTATEEKTEEQKSVGSLFSRMPSPWSMGVGISLGKKRGGNADGDSSEGSKKGKQPVRIVAPSIINDDSDDETDNKEPAAKKVKPSKSGSGLSSLLPKPKHSITLTATNRNKPSVKISNRALVPHTLTKKPASNKQAKAKKKKEDGNTSGDDDDDDSEPLSFFSFGDKKDDKLSVTGDPTKPVTSTSTSVSEILPQSSFSKKITVTSVREVTRTEGESSVSREELKTEPVTASYQGDESGYGYSGSSDGNPYHDSSEATTKYYQPMTDTSQPRGYGSYEQSSYTTYYDTQPSNSQYQEPVEQQAQTEDIDLERIQKLQGRKNRHEEINIIDINAADQTGDSKVRLTNLTAEQFAHRSSKKKGNMPSSQQRRKHQITYLAFQAKEREFELQQEWSSNRQTKRQTQAKYGF